VKEEDKKPEEQNRTKDRAMVEGSSGVLTNEPWLTMWLTTNKCEDLGPTDYKRSVRGGITSLGDFPKYYSTNCTKRYRKRKIESARVIFVDSTR
jgi:hypothetical protein